LPAPSLEQVAEFVRTFTGIGGAVAITSHTRLEADLGVTGEDGDECCRKCHVTLTFR